MEVAKPKRPVARVLVRMPFPATTLRIFQKMSCMSLKVIPRVFGFFRDMPRGVKAGESARGKEAEMET